MENEKIIYMQAVRHDSETKKFSNDYEEREKQKQMEKDYQFLSEIFNRHPQLLFNFIAMKMFDYPTTQKQ